MSERVNLCVCRLVGDALSKLACLRVLLLVFRFRDLLVVAHSQQLMFYFSGRMKSEEVTH